MNNIQNIECVIDKIELFSYFSPEIICLFAILLNIFFFMFFRRRLNVKRISDFITFGAFLLNTVILGSLLLRDKLFSINSDFTLFKDVLAFSDEHFIYKIIVNLFFICFIALTYKLTRKARFKTPLVNSYLLLLAISSPFLLHSQNVLLSFILLDISVFSIYKFASNMKMRNEYMYCADFVVMSVSATILFYSFYLIANIIKIELQTSILNVCAALALLLKVGLFPIYNYTLNRHYKNNIPYSILLFTFLPFLGVLTFAKFIESNILSSEVFLLTLLIFILVSILTCAINAFKTKNLVKYLANFSYVNFSLMTCALLFSQDLSICIKTGFTFLFAMLGVYSLLCILKINLKIEKVNFSSLSGLFIKNGKFCILFALIILIVLNIIPSAILQNNLELLKGIYISDKIASYVILTAIAANALCLYNGLFAIKMCYTKTKNIKPLLNKETAINYAVSLSVILFLMIKLFL
ncbi:hypothetical protein IJX73_03130 [bacterium]|nr:hypothetical protein [bacterium]